MKKTIVVNCHYDTDSQRKKNYIYIGRPSKWGNPFAIGKNGTREEVVQKYEEWIKTQSHLLKDLKDLKGKILGCWCKPFECHGDVLVELIKKLK